ncbi:Adenylate cyclase, class 3 [Candidatus Electrothrix marina]|uniref:Adenylate cyclase, class 3 n=1 Tax=Candidatus Electrothrix marina TaxID=1859130 RepID=A0A444JFK0_9BACT|nr:Adenylate cyclase, class 3 [Candidatus Electrothrix marina]
MIKYLLFSLSGFLACFDLFFLQISLFARPLNPEIPISQYLHKSYSHKNRIKSVLDIVQDDTGFLWLATYRDLIRFDGEEFLYYNRSTRDDFPASAARSLLSDSQGNLWVGTNDNGLFRFRDNIFTQFDIRDGLPGASVRELFEDRDGILWIGTTAGVASFDGTAFRRFTGPESLETKLVNFICQDAEGSIWVGTNQKNGVYVLKKGSDEFIPYQGELSSLTAEAPLEYMIKDNNGKGLWAITSDTLILIKENRIKKNFKLSFEQSRREHNRQKVANSKIFQDRNGALWLTGDSGLIRFYNGSFDFFNHADGLNDNIVFSAYQDKEGSLWLGTQPGLERLSEPKFTIYTQDEGLFDDTVNAVLEEKNGEFLVATNQGLNLVLPRSKKTEKLTDPLLRTRIRHLYKDRSGRVWVSTYGHGILIMENRKIVQQLSMKNGLVSDKVRLVLEDRTGNFWIGTQSGLSMLDRTGRLTNYTTDTAPGLINDCILCLHEDAAGKIWIGTDGGGVHIYENGEIQQRHAKDDGIPGNVVFRFYDDGEGGLWVMTNGGISILKDRTIHNLTSENGLLTDNVFEVLLDRKNKLWMTTTFGLFYVTRHDLNQVINGRKKSFPITLFDNNSGLKKNPASNAWSEQDSEGNFWIGTYGGAVVINPENIPINTISPKTIILSSNIVSRNSGKTEKKITVPADISRLNFHFAVLSFISPKKNLLQYKLDGFDQDWSVPGKQRDVSYTNLPPGNYVFRVKGMNNDGIPSQEEAMLAFYKTPHYYERLWFRLAAALSLLLLLILEGVKVHRNRIKKLNHTLAQQKIQIELERKATRAERLAKEQEKELSESYSRFVPHDFLNFLGKKSLLEVGLGDQVERTMTVLFADIRNFTAISEGLTPKETFDFINSFLGQIAPAVQHSEGFIDKYIGDAVMALFASAQQALHTAVQMNKILLDPQTQQCIKNHDQEIRIGIGINTGSLMLGTVGSEHRMDGTVISDAVNLASRIEQLTKYYGADILFTEKTYRRLSNARRWNIREVDRVMVKGKTQPVTLYEALDGLPEDIRSVKIASKKAFEEGVHLYRSGRMDMARKIFQDCLLHCPTDEAAKIYLCRCEHYLESGIGEDWDGVSRLDFK